MKRRIALLLILAMAVCLVGCKEEKKGGTKEEEKVTEAVTGTPTATPENTATPEPTKEITPMPTPDTAKLPHTELTEGPLYAIGTSTDGTAYADTYTSPNQPAFTSEIDFIYLTEDGYPGLAARMKEENNQHSESGAYYQNEILKILSVQTERFDKWLYYIDRITPYRNDSAVFSYTRSLSKNNGTIVTEDLTGYSFDTKTGEPLDWTDHIRPLEWRFDGEDAVQTYNWK
jgi:hypothetical protein